MSAYPCLGITYLSWGLDEDGLLEVTAECDGGPDGDCGWHENLTDEIGLTSAGFAELSKRHMQGRAAVYDAAQAMAGARINGGSTPNPPDATGSNANSRARE